MRPKVQNFIILFIICIAVSGATYANDLSDPYIILNKQYEALGGLDKIKAQKTTYTESDAEIIGTGLHGTVKSWTEYPTKSRNEIDLTVFKQMYGDNGEYVWTIDMNGKLQIVRDSISLIRRELSLLAADYEFLNRDSKYYNVEFEGTEVIDSTECYAIKIGNTLNDDYSIQYINKSTYLAVKTVTVTPDGEQHAFTSDYRDVNGVLTPFSIKTIAYPTGIEQMVEIRKIEINIEIDSELFEPPGEDVKDFEFTNGHSAEDIPFDYIQNQIYLPLEVAGKVRLWLLDSGASKTIISRKFAEELGLELEGDIKGQGAGNLIDVSYTVIPSHSLPGLNFNEQKVISIEIGDLFYKWIGLDIAGVLGCDFLTRLVVKVDYAKRLVSFFEPDEFEYKGSGTIIETPLSAGQFHVPIIVDGKYSGLWNLDLGASGMSFHYPYAEKYGFLNKPGVTGIASGAGGTMEVKYQLFKTVELGGNIIENIVFSMPTQQVDGAFSGGELTGNAGNSLFEHFVLYLDYKREQIIVEKGDDFDKVFPRRNSGLTVHNIRDKGLEVQFVSKNTPADKAGFMLGDIIVSVNEVKIDYLGGIVSFNKMMQEPPGTKFIIKVRRGDKVKELKLKLGDLFI